MSIIAIYLTGCIIMATALALTFVADDDLEPRWYRIHAMVLLWPVAVICLFTFWLIQLARGFRDRI